MKPIRLEDLETREVVPGYVARFVHTDNMTFSYWTIEAGASLPSHQHHHEQVSNLLEGEFQLTLEGQTHILKPGSVLIIPSQAVHSGTAITDCRILDVFYPCREDYK